MRVLFFVFLALLPHFLFAEANLYTGNYSGLIYKADIKDEIFAKSAEDLKIVLERLTSGKFKVEAYDSRNPISKGIYLLLDPKNIVDRNISSRLRAGSIEDFYIAATSERLAIVANHPLGLSRGIYTYLDLLGVKWYFPGEMWMHLPKMNSIALSIEQYFSPSFSMRDFFGTGGLFPVPAYAESKTIQKEWDDWKRRNRMGGSVKLAGHYWENFNLKYQNQLKEHPEYLAMINGRRVAWSVSAKFCISNPGLRKLFVEDRLKSLEVQLKNSSSSFEKVFIAVDPSDGGGHCECDDCKKMGSVSDRVFYLANLVARAAGKVSSRAFVNLYAYNEHAHPPAINIEKNVVIQIIPYAFQNVGTPKEMIDLWKKKTSQLFLYDYYGIPDWHFETPLSGKWSWNELANKLRYWKGTGIRGFLLESSYSIGATGPGLYLMSRLGWNIDENMDTILNRYYKEMFGSSWAFMKVYYDKTNHDFRKIADIPFLYQQLDRTSINTDDDLVKGRVDVLRAYVHYLVLFYQYENSKSQFSDYWEKLMSYVWQIYPLKAVHSTRIAQLLLIKQNIDKKLIDKWSIYNSSAPGLRSVKWLNKQELNAVVASDKRDYPLLKDFDYNPSGKVYEFKFNGKEYKSAELTLLKFPTMIVKMTDQGAFRFSVRANPGSAKNENQDLSIMLLDRETGETVWEGNKKIDKKWTEIEMKGKSGQTYQLYIKSSNWINFTAGARYFYYLEQVPEYSYPGKLWFYIPSRKEFFYFKNPANNYPSIYDPYGHEIKPSKVNNEGIYQVRVSKSGWWSIDKTELKILEFFLETPGFFPHPGYSVTERSMN